MFEQFPYSNFHEMNLDWVLKTIKTMQSDFNTFISQNAIKYANPIQWNITTQYEKNTVVVDVDGNGYLSVKAVPGGISIDRTEYWTVIGNFSALWGSVKNAITVEDEGHSITATKARSIGDLVWIENDLIHVSSNMGAGDAYVVGSNCISYSMQNLINSIAAEATARASADTTNANAIAAEATARASADTTNANAIAAEATARASADTANANAIAAEATTRAGADTTNANAIAAEATARENADTANANAIAAEATARANADIALQEAIDNIEIDTSIPGVVGDGIADDTIALQNAINAVSGKTLSIPAGTYKVTATLSVPANTTIIGYGAKLSMTTATTILLTLNSGCKVYGLELQGSGNASYDVNCKAISIDGGSVASYITNVTVQDCNIHDFKAVGVFFNFAKYVNIINCKIKNITYAGCGGGCSENVHITGCNIDNITPGTGGNAYGVYFSRDHIANITASPNCKHCSVKNSIISNVAIWEAIDTHGGEYIVAEGNTITGCATGILFGASKNESSVAMLAPNFCKAVNNTIIGNGQGSGVLIEGVADDYGENNLIEGNTIINCGAQSNTSMGAIWLKNYLDGTIVKGNHLMNSFSIGIAVNGSYIINSVIMGNIVDEVLSTTSTSAPGIAINGYYCSGIVVGNVLKRTDDIADVYVSERGIYGRTGYSNNFMIANNQNNFVLPYSTLTADNTRSEMFNGLSVRIGAGSPEGVVVGSPGDLYLNTTGGVSTTLYVKQTGSATNTGWAAK